MMVGHYNSEAIVKSGGGNNLPALKKITINYCHRGNQTKKKHLHTKILRFLGGKFQTR